LYSWILDDSVFDCQDVLSVFDAEAENLLRKLVHLESAFVVGEGDFLSVVELDLRIGQSADQGSSSSLYF
jgi:hypothetical protein